MKKSTITSVFLATLALILLLSLLAFTRQGADVPRYTVEGTEKAEADAKTPDRVTVFVKPINESTESVFIVKEKTAGTKVPVVEESPAPEDPAFCEVPSLASACEIELLARTIWGEAEIVKIRSEQAAVAWCVLNRVDYYGESIENIILAPYQFVCRLEDEAVPDYYLELAADVVVRWEREHAGFEDVGRTLPADYRFFTGDGWRNYFSSVWQGTDYWDWSLPDPYTEEGGG